MSTTKTRSKQKVAPAVRLTTLQRKADMFVDYLTDELKIRSKRDLIKIANLSRAQLAKHIDRYIKGNYVGKNKAQFKAMLLSAAVEYTKALKIAIENKDKGLFSALTGRNHEGVYPGMAWIVRSVYTAEKYKNEKNPARKREIVKRYIGELNRLKRANKGDVKVQGRIRAGYISFLRQAGISPRISYDVKSKDTAARRAYEKVQGIIKGQKKTKKTASVRKEVPKKIRRK